MILSGPDSEAEANEVSSSQCLRNDESRTPAPNAATEGPATKESNPEIPTTRWNALSVDDKGEDGVRRGTTSGVDPTGQLQVKRAPIWRK